MSRPNSPQSHELNDAAHLLTEVYALRNDPAAWQDHLINGLCRLFHASQGACVRFSKLEPVGEVTVASVVATPWTNPRALADWVSSMGEFRWRDDPLVDRISQETSPIVTVLREELMSDKEWNSSVNPHYELAQAADVASHLLMLHRAQAADGGKITFAVTMHRPFNSQRFSPRERDTLDVVNRELCQWNTAGVLRFD